MKTPLLMLAMLLFFGCNFQEKESKIEDASEQEKTGIQPKERSQVHKEYDEHGNLIRYDSIYSWSYSNIDGDSVVVNLDSIMDAFRNYFNNSSPFEWNDDFSYFPRPDSLFLKDFFKDDYFLQHWEDQDFNVEEMIKKMDSTRNAFLRRFHPGLLESSKDSI
ncbi:hypothetical protein [Poritiphilus flavus]|uniref:Lipoprotein n=1 Tax=Poritiphilus flavus TaxID=2697053 RepID=A0A6L9EC01_9FLAO|nr:hypothetical protein [Poritiphilus flavus]NAS12274.1 hypothetical protein [Poritiphilus flavus]